MIWIHKILYEDVKKSYYLGLNYTALVGPKADHHILWL